MDGILLTISAKRSRKERNLSQYLLYSIFQVGYQTCNDTFMALPILYTEVIGLDMSVVSSTLGIGDALALVSGTLAGYMSDELRSVWGKRKPFIFVGTIFLISGLLANAHPPTQDIGRSNPQKNLSLCTTPINCTVARACAEEDIHSKAHTDEATILQAPATGIAIWYAATLLCLQFGKSAAAVPYAAMGQEMSSDSKVLVIIFGLRGMLSYVGILSRIVIHTALANAFGSDYARQMHILSIYSACCMAACMLLTCLTTTPTVKNQLSSTNEVNIVSTFRSAIISNKIYLHYSLMRSLFSFGYLLPYLQASSFIKFVLHDENTPLTLLKFQLIMLLSALLGATTIKTLAYRIGYQRCSVLAAEWGVLLFSTVLLAGESLGPGIFFLAVGIAPLKVVFFSLFDSYVASVIDFDQLKSSSRREGVFVAADQACLSVVLILIFAVSGSLMSAAGYVGNGGCTCGCGNKCTLSYLRWSCPNDDGYACNGIIQPDNILFYGDPYRIAPCTMQNRAVSRLLLGLFSGVPALGFFAAIVLLKTFPITDVIHKELKDQLELQASGQIAFDPLTYISIGFRSKEDLKVSNIVMTFTARDIDQLKVADSFDEWAMLFYYKTIKDTAVIFIIVLAVFFLPQSLGGCSLLVILAASMVLVWNALKVQVLRTTRTELEAIKTRLTFVTDTPESGTLGTNMRPAMRCMVATAIFRWRKIVCRQRVDYCGNDRRR